MKKGRLETNLRTHGISMKGSRALLKWRWEQYQQGAAVLPSTKKRRHDAPPTYLQCERTKTAAIGDHILYSLVLSRLISCPLVLFECLFVSRQLYTLAHRLLLLEAKSLFGDQYGTPMSYSIYLMYDQMDAPLSKMSIVKRFWLKPNVFKNTPYEFIPHRLVGAIHAEHGYVEHLQDTLRSRALAPEAKQREDQYVLETLDARLAELNTLISNTAYGTRIQFGPDALIVDAHSTYILDIMFLGGERFRAIMIMVKDYLHMETTISPEKILHVLLPYPRVATVFNYLYDMGSAATASLSRSYVLYYLLFMFYAPSVVIYGVELSEQTILECIKEVIRSSCNLDDLNYKTAVCEWNAALELNVYYVTYADLTWAQFESKHPCDPEDRYATSMAYFDYARRSHAFILHTRRQTD